MSGKELLEKIAGRRKESCSIVLSSPDQFKICNSCQSLLQVETVFCPFCKAYGFEVDKGKIIDMARLLGDRPLSYHCAVLPRNASIKALSYA